jgi:ketosteroid isomerase-like protein
MEARQLIETYHNAWSSGDFVSAQNCLAPDLDFWGSIDAFSQAEPFIARLRQFHSMLRGVTVLRRFFDSEGGALLYDCDTVSPAGLIRTAEFFTVRDGKITEIRLVFDATELRKLMQP